MSNERGFTLPELVVAIVVLTAALLATALLLQPADYSLSDRESERRLELAAISQALAAYRADNGVWPADMPSQETDIGSLDGAYDLCAALVPKYLKDMPLEPVAGVKSTVEGDDTTQPCNARGVGYMSGYTIATSTEGHIVVGLAVPEQQDIRIAQ